jgi:ATP-dependent exoDNAse (exonuclease V) beta subunit
MSDHDATESPVSLTAEQELAVCRRGEPLLVSAGAGSGKTRVLVERFVRAVCEDGYSPTRILAITFTDRAAGELRERVRARLLECAQRDAALDAEAAFISTFHGFCTRVLRSHALLAGLDPRFEILDEAMSARERDRAFAQALGEFVAGERGEAVELVAAYGADRLRAMLWGTYAELRSRGQRHPRLPRASAADERDAALACALLDELLALCGRAYEARKRARGALDFDDLELLALELLSSTEDVRRTWSERFEELMVDEFQDTNPRQLAILEALERGNLFTVGDEQQSIYGFRDADVRIFRARREALEQTGGSLELVCNFRSRAPLLAVVNAAFEARSDGRHTALVAGREAGPRTAGEEPAVELLLTDKRGWNGDGDGEEENGAGRSGAGAPGWRRAEARALAGRVAELVRSGEVCGGEVVVLLRALGDIETYERALREAGLRTLASAGGFWRRQQVVDLVAYLRALANPFDELAMYGALAGPLGGISSDGLALIARVAHARREPVWVALRDGAAELGGCLREDDRARLAGFLELFERERASAAQRGVAHLLERALREGGYEDHVRALDDAERRMANVHKLLRLARRFEAGEGRDLRGFLEHVAHQEGLARGPEADAPVAGTEPDAVRLMSIHAAKGLEFDVVCVADLGRALNVGVSDLLVDGERVGLRLARLDGAPASPALAFDELCDERQRAQAGEEDRVLYVAMTRARERLLLSGAVSFARWPEVRLGAPILSWLGPALCADLPQLVSASVDEGQAVFDFSLDAVAGGRVRCRLNAPALLGRDTPAPLQLELALGPLGAKRGADDALGSVDAAARGRSAGAESSPRQKVSALTEPAVRPEQIDSLSYTALSQLERCGYRFYLERVLGLEERTPTARTGVGGSAALDARVRGTIVHALLERVDFARAAPRTAADVAELTRALGLRASEHECEQLAQLANVAVAALSDPSSPAARAAAARDVRREHQFAFSLSAGEPLITGVIDLLARERGGSSLVIDYKTDRVSDAERLGELVAREYGIQRLIYALAVLRAGAPAVEIVHWFLERPGGWVSQRYDAGEQSALRGQLAARLTRALARGYAVSELPHRGLCETCPGRARLCSWGEELTMRELPVSGAVPASAADTGQVVSADSAR